LAKQEFLNFKEICNKISFEDVLNWLNISFQKTEKEFTSESFIISRKKNLYFNPKNQNETGSIINFVAHHKNVDVRQAASMLKAEFLSHENEIKIKREIPNLELHYHDYLIERGIIQEVASEYEVGLVKQRSIMSGCIACKAYDREHNHIGYVGYKLKENTWYFPKGFIRPLYNADRIITNKIVLVTTDPFDALRLISIGELNVVSLLAKNMSSRQEEMLRQYPNILLLHTEPDNIVQRLAKYSSIKAPLLEKKLKEYSTDELTTLIKPAVT